MTKFTVDRYLNYSNKTLANVLTRITKMRQWNVLFTEALANEPELRTHCQIVGIRGTILVVIADNSHWATRFRFYIPAVLNALKQHPDLRNIGAIHCKISPSYEPPVIKYPKPKQLSPKSAEILKETANKITDENLKNILEKIAGYVKDE